MSTVLIAIGLATLAACCYASSVTLQHTVVRSVTPAESVSVSELGRVVRSPRWMVGLGFAILGCALHVTALTVAPLTVVQPIGVLSLVVTVAFGARAKRAPGTGVGVVAICGGVGGFVALATMGQSAATPILHTWPAQLVALGAIVLAVSGLRRTGMVRCVVLATAAAILFGLGSALIRAGSQDILHGGGAPSGALFAVEAIGLMVVGGWLVHQAYAAGPAAVVIATTTVIDPFTAVMVGLGVYGESAHTGSGAAVAEAAFALLAVTGVVFLARTLPDIRKRQEPTLPASTGPARILIGADTFPPDVNGAAHFAQRLAVGLVGRGHEVHVVCPDTAPGMMSLPQQGIVVHRVPSVTTPFHPTFRICMPWQAKRSASTLVARIRPDIVHVQSHFLVGRAVLVAAHEQGIPTVATNHFMPENLVGYAPIPPWLGELLARWAWRDLARVYRRAEVITAPTQRAVELLAASAGIADARSVSCGLDVDHYATVRTRRGTTSPSVLFVGRLDREKHVDELIRAVAKVPLVRAEIIGDGSCRDQLGALANDLNVTGRVHFRGFVSDEDLVRAYGSCDVFCMPGTAELQSLATMEAMAAGLPVVAADAMALPHLVHHGVTGYRYTPGDVGELAASIAELAENATLRQDMGRAGQTAIAAHKIDYTLDAFDVLYREAIGKSSERRERQAPAPVLRTV